MMDEIFPYTPRKARFDILEKTFVAREALLEELIKDIKQQSEADTLQHWMVLGARGMGKSHLITLIYYRVKQDDYLKVRWIPLLMNEEEQGVFSLHSLFIRFLTKLGDEIKKENDPKADQIYNFLKDLREKISSPDEILETVISYLRDFVKHSKKRLLVLLENADDLLMHCIHKENEIRKLRKILQHENFLLLLATSPTFFERIKSSKEALYDFFRYRWLSLLEYNHALILLKKWAEIENDTKLIEEFEPENYRLKVLYHLTGGNPRILLFLYQAISGQEGLSNAVKTFGLLLEKDLSNYYLSRMRDLPNQEQPIVLALAESNRNLTQTEIARKTFLPVKSVGTAMVRLENSGLICPVSEKKGKNTLYTLTDHLFRLWHQWRTQLRERTVIEAVVEFLSIWYKRKELEELALEEGLIAEYSKEALSFRMSEKFRGYGALLYSEFKESIDNYLEEKDYHLVFETMESLKEHGIDTTNAEDSILMTIEQSPKDSGAWKLLGVVRNKQKKWAEAEGALSHAVELAPTDAASWFHFGHSRFHMKKWVGAEKAFLNTVKLDPGSITAWKLLGSTRVMQKNYAGAEEAFLQAIEIDAGDSKVRLKLGCVYCQQKNYERAKEILVEALRLNPNNPEALYRLGHVFAKDENYVEAEKIFLHCIELNLKDSDAWANLGEARFRQKNYPGAEEAMLRALEINPNNKWAWRHLGIIRGNQGNHAGAEEAFFKATELDPENVNAWKNLGRSRYYQKNYTGAEEALLRAVQIAPGDYHILHTLAHCNLLNFQFKTSANNFLKCIKLKNKEISNYKDMCDLFLRSPEDVNPFKILEKALRIENISDDLKCQLHMFRAMLNLYIQERRAFKKDLRTGITFFNSLSDEIKQNIQGQLISFLVDNMYDDNIEEIQTYVDTMKEFASDLTSDFTSIITPLTYTIDYFREYYLSEKKNIPPLKRAQQVLERIPSELRGPVEEMVEKVKENIQWWRNRPKEIK